VNKPKRKAANSGQGKARLDKQTGYAAVSDSIMHTENIAAPAENQRRFELPLADGDGGSCMLVCPICSNTASRIEGFASTGSVLIISIRNSCGHSWTLELIQHQDELRLEARL
jgi:hypothetical protein